MQTVPSQPAAGSPDVEFQQFLRDGRFMIQRSRSSGGYVFYPRVAEPVTGALDLEWVPATGLGTVYSATVIRPRSPAEPYNVCLIDLDEGPRMMSRVDDVSSDRALIGMRVKARIVVESERPIVVFTPLQEIAA